VKPLFHHNDIIDNIKASTNLCQLAEELQIARRWGAWLCPFHDDHHPSLGIWERGFRCFACGTKGDAIRFVMLLKGIGYGEALAYLARRAGVLLPERNRQPRLVGGCATVLTYVRKVPRATDKPAVSPQRRTEILTAFAKAAGIRQDPSDDHPALKFFQSRGISYATARAAGIGYISDYRFASTDLRKAIPLDELQAVGLFNAKGNFRLFKHRLVIPYAVEGEVYFLQARNLDWRSQELDGPKQLTFGPVSIPYNADLLLQPQEVVHVCEGVTDTLSLIELGLPAVGIPGVNNFRPEWVCLFEDVQDIVLAFDNDAAGHRGAATVAELFRRAGRTVRVLELPEGIKDISEYLMA
jgi:DNA primase catalytic core